MRPCKHSFSVSDCHYCRWCLSDTDKGRKYRRKWGEKDPFPAKDYEELLPGIRDPLGKQPADEGRHLSAWQEMASVHYPPPERSGRGILAIGGGKYWPGLVMMIRLLRETGCSLPVQVWYRASEERVFPSDVSGMNVTLVNADQFRLTHPCRTFGGWQLKSYAMIHCGWRQVHYIDADAYHVADPTPLFSLLEDAPFCFWKDLEDCRGNLRWLPQDDTPPVQGGQTFVDVVGFWREIVLAYFCDQHSDYFYGKMHGDQDGIRAALIATRKRFNCLGNAEWTQERPLNGAFVCSWEGRPLIVHRCQSKFFVDKPPLPIPNLPLEAHVHEMFHQLPGNTVMGLLHPRGWWGQPEPARPERKRCAGCLKTRGRLT